MPLNPQGHVLLEVGPTGAAPTRTLQLPVNPDTTLAPDVRVTLLQGLTTINVENYGLGIPQLTLQGNCAVASPYGRYNGQPVDGEGAAQALYWQIFHHFMAQSVQRPMTWAIYADNTHEAYQVIPQQAPQFQRTHQAPLQLYYTLTFWVLADLLRDAPPGGIVTDPLRPLLASPTRRSAVAAAQAIAAGTRAGALAPHPTTTYVVQSGDTLAAIAQRFVAQPATAAQIAAAVQTLQTANQLPTAALITPGLVLTIPLPLR